jgi:hypothetical protein
MNAMMEQQAAVGQGGQDDQQQEEEVYEEYDQGTGAQPIACLEVHI